MSRASSGKRVHLKKSPTNADVQNLFYSSECDINTLILYIDIDTMILYIEYNDIDTM